MQPLDSKTQAVQALRNLVAALPLAERLRGLSPEERLHGLTPEELERLRQLLQTQTTADASSRSESGSDPRPAWEASRSPSSRLLPGEKRPFIPSPRDLQEMGAILRDLWTAMTPEERLKMIPVEGLSPEELEDLEQWLQIKIRE